MKTILYLSATGEISGGERSLLAMLDALDRSRWEPTVAAPEGPLLDEVAARKVRAVPVRLAPVHRPQGPRDLFAALRLLPRGWRAVADAVKTTAPDVLHANSAYAMLYALLTRKAPVVWHARDNVSMGPAGYLMYLRAALVVAISAAVKKELLPYTRDSGAKIVVIPPAVDTERFCPAQDRRALRQHLGLPLEMPLVGMIAQFVPWKRHDLFFDALERLADQYWHAVLAGADFNADAAYVAALRKRIARPPLARRVTWLPWQPDPAPLIAALDICVLTSDREPFGRVLIEAMACGAPVIAMDEGGPRDIIIPGITGLLVPPGARAVAELLLSLLQDAGTRERMGRAARDRAVARFSLPIQRRLLTALYSRVLDL